MSQKRSRSAEGDGHGASAPEGPRKAAKNDTAAPKGRKIDNGNAAPLVRTPEALACYNTKKTKEEIWSTVAPFARLTTDKDFDANTMMKIITWNVAGLRGQLKKDDKCIATLLAKEKPDVLCLQETKLNVSEAAANAALGLVEDYVFIDHPCAVKKGYSGVRLYLKKSSVVEAGKACCSRGFAVPDAAVATPEKGVVAVPVCGGAGDEEGRVISTLLSPSSAAAKLCIINTYVANSGMGLDRLPYRINCFDKEMREYLKKVDAHCTSSSSSSSSALSGFIWTGDLNVAERDFDRYYAGTYKTMQDSSGFSPEERFSFRQTMKETNSVDSFRELYPNAGPVYTFWSTRLNGRDKGWGWRLDYFVLSSRLSKQVVDCFPMPEVTSSDHCPVQLWLRKP